MIRSIQKSLATFNARNSIRAMKIKLGIPALIQIEGAVDTPVTPVRLNKFKSELMRLASCDTVLQLDLRFSIPKDGEPEKATFEMAEITDLVLLEEMRLKVWNKWIGASVGTCLCPLCQKHKIQQLGTTWSCSRVLSTANGGENKVENLRPVCTSCHQFTGKMSMREYCQRHEGGAERLQLP